MSQTPRRLLMVPAGAVVAAWAVLYLVVITTAPLSYDPATESAAKVNREFALLLAVPTALWVTAALTLVEHWWSRTGIRLSAMDPPGRLLAAAVATLPDHRREWGMAMHAELAELQGRSARWQYALSSARAVLRLPPLGGWPALALVTGVVAAAVAAAGPAVEAAVPGLGVFAVSFVGLVGAMVVLAVARSRRMRLPVAAPTLLVTGGVAAAMTMTVIFLLRDPAAARYLPPANAVFLAAVLAGCLWIAVAAPRSLSSNRLAPHLGVAAAVVLVVGQLLLMRAGLPSQDLFDEVVDDVPVVPREPGDEAGDVVSSLHRQRGQLERGDPAFGASLQGCDVARHQAEPGDVVEVDRRFVEDEAQVGGSELDQLTARPQAGQGQRTARWGGGQPLGQQGRLAEPGRGGDERQARLSPRPRRPLSRGRATRLRRSFGG
jgi:hypothetical protein